MLCLMIRTCKRRGQLVTNIGKSCLRSLPAHNP